MQSESKRYEVLQRSCRWLIVVSAVLLSGHGLTIVSRAEKPITPTSDPPSRRISFLKDIQPILASRCLKCHGPDAEKREAEFRIDTREGLFKDLGDKTAVVVPHNLKSSALFERITTSDVDLRMPPPDSKMELTSEQIQKIRQWIEQGATYEEHWAFKKPVRSPLPDVKDQQWPRNSIDYFILSRLEQAGLTPAPSADPYQLVRRVYLDLTGLPPTPEQADAYVNDTRADAYERLVDQLLDSPHYGEHWARYWLDLARFADTNGYEKDRPRSVWPYRDWVIQSINDDMSFQQFTIEQFAGDLLPEPTLQQKIATGFHRNTLWNEEGGIDVEEFRFASIIDRVSTTGTIWLGLTVGCAQCHTHKYDPIQQREFYQLFAFLNNADEPELTVPDAGITKQRQEIQQQITASKEKLKSEWLTQCDKKTETEKRAHFQQEFQAWISKNRKQAHHWKPLHATQLKALNRATLTALEDGSVLASGDRPNNDTYIAAYPIQESQQVTAIRLEVLPHDSLPDRGPGRASFQAAAVVGHKGDFMLSEFEVSLKSGSDKDAKIRRLILKNATEDFAPENTSAAKTIDGTLDTGWKITGQIGKPHQCVYELEQPLTLQAGDQLIVTLKQQYIHEMTLGCFRISVTSDKSPVAASEVPAEIESILLLREGDWSVEQKMQVEQHFLMTTPELKAQQEQIQTLQKSIPEQPTTLVLQERLPQHQRVTRLHHRGEYLKPGDIVQPGTLGRFHTLPEQAPPNRLTLARWLVDPENPLVGRVVVNRWWQALFGTGIVRTSEDFGTQASPPTHPELLDWLATEFIQNGWSRKKLLRLIVTSATYRQSSHVTPEKLARDPQNSLLSRGPRVRLAAEVVRDSALTASGLLTRKIGGPSVFPPQPAGVTALSYGTLAWNESTGADRYRRGLYTFIKRTTPYATFGLFDAPSREACVVRRSRSNTPLQALTLLNDVVFMEVAVELGKKTTLSDEQSPQQRATTLFRRVLTRPPSREEVEKLVHFYDQQLDRLKQNQNLSQQLLGTAASSSQAEISQPEWAAWTLVARAILNMDEAVTKE
jgi:hypothetical protein